MWCNGSINALGAFSPSSNLGIPKFMRVSYSGYYATFPKLRWRFDSAHPLHSVFGGFAAPTASPLRGSADKK